MSDNDIYNILKMLASKKISIEQAKKLIDIVINYRLIRRKTS